LTLPQPRRLLSVAFGEKGRMIFGIDQMQITVPAHAVAEARRPAVDGRHFS
jgi:hypothetical protein